MKRYIRESKYLSDTSSALFDDSIVIDIDVTFPMSNVASSTSINKFPGIIQFKEDVLHILEDEYKFEVIEDTYDGKLQKGYITNREDSVSVYFDTFYDLSNADASLRRLGVSQSVPEPTQIFCFIHIRFSDHTLNDEGDQLHQKFLKENVDKYTKDRQDVTHVVKEENIEIDKKSLYMYYDQALEDLRDALDVRTLYWIKKADRFRKQR